MKGYIVKNLKHPQAWVVFFRNYQVAELWLKKKINIVIRKGEASEYEISEAEIRFLPDDYDL